MTKTIIPVYNYNNSTFDHEKARKAIIEVYGENLFTEEFYASDDETDDDEINHINTVNNETSKNNQLPANGA